MVKTDYKSEVNFFGVYFATKPNWKRHSDFLMWLYFIENYHKESLQSRLRNSYSSSYLPRKTQTDLRTRGLRLRSKELNQLSC